MRQVVSDLFGSIEGVVPPEFMSLVKIATRVEAAATLLSASYAEEGVKVTPPIKAKPHRRPAHKKLAPWYSAVVNDSVARIVEVQFVLRERSPVGGVAAQVKLAVFEVLSELTPARHQLQALLVHDQVRAFAELADQIGLIGKQFEATAALVGRSGAAVLVANGRLSSAQDADAGSAERFSAVRDALLAQAGGAYSLTEAAKRLGITRQGLHKRIHAGTALGMMREDDIVVPKLQFVPDQADRHGPVAAGNKVVVLPGIDRVVRTFQAADAGLWAALQFLVDHDPNLACCPMDALKAGNIDKVEHAARSRLGMDEE